MMDAKPSSQVRKFLLIFFIPALLLLVGLSLALRDFVRDAIIIPLAYLWTLLGLLYQSTPQVVFWGIFLLISFVILVKVFGSVKRDDLTPNAYSEMESMAPARDRIYYWLIQVQLALHGNLYFRDKVMRSMEKIVLGVIAYQERLTLKEVEYAINHRNLEVPEDIAVLFKNEPEDFSDYYPGTFPLRVIRWMTRIAESFKRITGKKETSTQQEQLEAIIEYLDNQLEIKHGA